MSEGFQNSVNLVFIRILRDIEHYYMFKVKGTHPGVLADWDDPSRPAYLNRFADLEGNVFLKRFYEKYQRQTPDQALNTLVSHVNLTPLRAAVIYRSVRPEDNLDRFSAFLEAHLSKPALAREDLGELYAKYGPDRFNLQDRGVSGPRASLGRSGCSITWSGIPTRNRPS